MWQHRSFWCLLFVCIIFEYTVRIWHTRRRVSKWSECNMVPRPSQNQLRRVSDVFLRPASCLCLCLCLCSFSRSCSFPSLCVCCTYSRSYWLDSGSIQTRIIRRHDTEMGVCTFIRDVPLMLCFTRALGSTNGDIMFSGLRDNALIRKLKQTQVRIIKGYTEVTSIGMISKKLFDDNM